MQFPIKLSHRSVEQSFDPIAEQNLYVRTIAGIHQEP